MPSKKAVDKLQQRKEELEEKVLQVKFTIGETTLHHGAKLAVGN